jgi:hypothetical protein
MFKRRVLMATFTKRPNGKWQAKIRKKGYKTLSNTFSRKSDAITWSKEKELEMERGSFESTAKAERVLLCELLDQFWDEVVSKYKSASGFKYKINFLKKVLGHIHLIDLSVDVVREFK